MPLGTDNARNTGTRARPSSRSWAQPRPQFGFLPWLAFFLARSFRLTVRFDIRLITLAAIEEASRRLCSRSWHDGSR